MLCKHLEPSIRAIVKDFYTNLGDRRNLTCCVRGRWVAFGQRVISQLFGIRQGGDYTEYERLQKNPNFEEIEQKLTGGQEQWQRIRTISNAFINRGDLTKVGKVWFYFVNSMLKPSKHVSTVSQDRAILLYALVKGYALNVGTIMEESILDYVEGKFSKNIPHPSLITLLCIKGGVKFNEVEEERCPKVSPLTLVGVFKAPIESEEGERREKPTRKRKRLETKEMRDQALTAAFGEGNNSGGVDMRHI